jgi:hypothetical protein
LRAPQWGLSRLADPPLVRPGHPGRRLENACGRTFVPGHAPGRSRSECRAALPDITSRNTLPRRPLEAGGLGRQRSDRLSMETPRSPANAKGRLRAIARPYLTVYGYARVSCPTANLWGAIFFSSKRRAAPCPAALHAMEPYSVRRLTAEVFPCCPRSSS